MENAGQVPAGHGPMTTFHDASTKLTALQDEHTFPFRHTLDISSVGNTSGKQIFFAALDAATLVGDLAKNYEYWTIRGCSLEVQCLASIANATGSIAVAHFRDPYNTSVPSDAETAKKKFSETEGAQFLRPRDSRNMPITTEDPVTGSQWKYCKSGASDTRLSSFGALAGIVYEPAGATDSLYYTAFIRGTFVGKRRTWLSEGLTAFASYFCNNYNTTAPEFSIKWEDLRPCIAVTFSTTSNAYTTFGLGEYMAYFPAAITFQVPILVSIGTDPDGTDKYRKITVDIDTNFAPTTITKLQASDSPSQDEVGFMQTQFEIPELGGFNPEDVTIEGTPTTFPQTFFLRIIGEVTPDQYSMGITPRSTGVPKPPKTTFHAVPRSTPRHTRHPL